ncbi:MAG: hypothetical protein K0S68_405 [Candidatus Saccharibacteria bacterium]|jgi:hypothetical protein|nr:hypothetical protein [Candidatus Saccharibacteria bacterium]
MKAYILFNRNTPEERVMERLVKQLVEADVDAEMLDADSPRGIQFTENYDILARPAIVVVRDDGSPLQVWQEQTQFPSVQDLAYLARR